MKTIVGKRWTWLANLVIIAGFLYAAALFILVLQKGGWSPANLVFLLPLAFLAAVFAGSLTLPLAYKANLALLLTSVVLSLLLVDVIVAFQARSASAKLRGSIDARNWGEIVPALRDRDTLAYLNTVWAVKKGSLDLRDRRVLPLSPGIGGVITILCNETGEYVRYLSDPYGFRNPPEIWQSTVELLLVGDSYTHGSCVTGEHTIAEQLRSHWPETLNLGVGGAGPLWDLAVLLEYGSSLAPPVVLWLYYEGNDLADLATEYQSATLRQYLEPGFRQDLRAQRVELDSALAHLHDSIVMRPEYFSTRVLPIPLSQVLRHTFTLANLRALLAIGVTSPLSKSVYARLELVLRRAQAAVSGWGGVLYFVYLPAYPRYATWLGSGIEGRTAVLRIVERLGIPLIDLHPVFERQPDPTALWWNPSSHYNNDGYALVAKTLIQRLLDNGRG